MCSSCCEWRHSANDQACVCVYTCVCMCGAVCLPACHACVQKNWVWHNAACQSCVDVMVSAPALFCLSFCLGSYLDSRDCFQFSCHILKSKNSLATNLLFVTIKHCYSLLLDSSVIIMPRDSFNVNSWNVWQHISKAILLLYFCLLSRGWQPFTSSLLLFSWCVMLMSAGCSNTFCISQLNNYLSVTLSLSSSRWQAYIFFKWHRKKYYHYLTDTCTHLSFQKLKGLFVSRDT